MSGTLNTTQYVGSGSGSSGTDSGTTLVSGGAQFIGFAFGTGTATDTTISGGTQYVGDSGGTGYATTTYVTNQGHQIVGLSGGTGTAVSTTIGGVQEVGVSGGTGYDTNATIYGGAEQLIGVAGVGTATSTSVLSNGRQYVGYFDSGTATAIDAAILGGVQYVGADYGGVATASGTTVSGGFLTSGPNAIPTYGTQYVGYGGSGTATDTTVEFHGLQIVGYGDDILFNPAVGLAISTTIETSGIQQVGVDGGAGTADYTTIAGGSQYLGLGSGNSGAATHTVDSGAQFVGYDFGIGSADSTTVFGVQHVGDVGGAGTATNTIISGGYQIVGESGGTGYASNTTIASGGIQYVGRDSGFGTATSTTIESGGVQAIGFSAGYNSATEIAISTTIEGGVQYVGYVSGGIGSATDTTIDAAGTQYVGYVSGFGTATRTMVESGGVQYVGYRTPQAAATALAISTTILGGGVEYVGVQGNGTATSATVSGVQYVGYENFGSGTATDTTVESGGSQFVGYNISAQAGTSATGTATRTTILTGGVQYVGGVGAVGVATSTTISGGAEYVGAGGTATDTLIYGGGLAEIQAGGFVEAAVIDGGALQLDAGAAVGADAIDFAAALGADGGKLDLVGEGVGYTLAAAISGFAGEGGAATLSDLIDVAGSGATDHVVWTQGGGSGTLQVEDAGDNVLETLTLDGVYDQRQFVLTEPSPTVDEIAYDSNAPCYVAGTRIATPDGEVAIEALRIGDNVLTPSGALRPIVWIGWREIDCTRHPHPESVWPVRVLAGAVAPLTPARDLVVSPDHSLFFEGVLIPVGRLVNGTTIVQDRVETVSYWHVELDRHDLLVAEGMAAESYLDTRNRAAFANGGSVASLHPDFSPQEAWREDAHWAAHACAPRHLDGPVWLGVRKALALRAAELGARTTKDPGVQVVADGEVLTPVSVAGGRFCFDIPEDAQSLRLRSRSAVPAQYVEANSLETRRLGVCATRIVLDERDIALNGPEFSEGWHEVEGDAAQYWRWSNGDAELPVGRRMTLWLEPLPVAYPVLKRASLHTAAASSVVTSRSA